MTNPNVIPCPPTALKPAPRNARTHSPRQIAQIAESIRAFGLTNPVLIDSEDRIVAGHGRVEAAKKIGLETVPIIRLDHLTAEQVRAYVIADNRLAELAGWDKDLLALELGDLATIDLDYSIEVTGFELPEIDLMIQGLGDEEDATEDPPPEPDPGPPVTQPGDLWRLGDHRLFCGDAQDRAAYQTLLAGERAEMVFTDPPYNVPIKGHVSGLGTKLHREFAMASGEMSKEGFASFLKNCFDNMATVSTDGGLHYICMDWRHMDAMLSAGSAAYTELKNLVIWTKNNGGMGSLYRSQHELVFVWKAGAGKHVNNVDLGRHGRNRTNVWTYPGVNSFGAERDDALAMHPTVKPVAMIGDALLDASNRGGLVLDPFAGSGTILIAAERTGRKARAMEIDPAYCDVAIRRWQAATGEVAILGNTDRTFGEIAAQRQEVRDAA